MWMAFWMVLAADASAASSDGEIVLQQVRTETHALQVVRVADGLEHPWGLAFLPDGNLLITERPGRLKRIRHGEATDISGLPEIHAHNQGGLLDLVLHPEFEDNRWVYLTYAKGDAQGTATTLARGRLEDDALTDVQELFTQDRRSSPGRHYGSRLAWTPDGHLLMSIGDRGTPERAQDLQDHAGSLLRLTEEGEAPDDNPFVDREDAHDEIFSYGNRNIQGLVVHPQTGVIWATEHGPRGGDELNPIRSGENYGWPVASKGKDYRTGEPIGVRSKPGMVDPVTHWTPALAPSGLALVTGERFPEWQGNLLAGGLRGQQIRRLVIEDGEVTHQEPLLEEALGRIRDVREGPDGHIYLLTDAPDGGVFRLEPEG